MADIIRFIISCALTIGGLFVLITGVVGLFRFKYSLTRTCSSPWPSTPPPSPSSTDRVCKRAGPAAARLSAFDHIGN